MGGNQLAKLTRIEDIRTVWPRERQDFSAWLLGNGEHLGEVLGIEVELDHAEEPVGDFALDLVGRDLTNDAILIVENQLESSDHSHLGQVLVYAAGTGAGTIVWVAKQFRAEHRQALNWLNENTDDDSHFFGVEVAAVLIDESLPAPLLTLVVQPSDWQKRLRQRTSSSRSTGRARLYAEFWDRFIERVRGEHPDWTRRGLGTRSENWLDMPSGIRGTYIAASFARGRRLRHELYIDCGDAEENLALLRSIESQREAFEGSYGRALSFEELPEGQACRIAEYRDDADVSHTDRHDEFVAWFVDCGERLRAALRAIELVS